MMNNRRVLKTSRNLFNSSKDNIEMGKDSVHKDKSSIDMKATIHMNNGSNDTNPMYNYPNSGPRSLIMK